MAPRAAESTLCCNEQLYRCFIDSIHVAHQVNNFFWRYQKKHLSNAHTACYHIVTCPEGREKKGTATYL